jgi:hypothetical protein
MSEQITLKDKNFEPYIPEHQIVEAIAKIADRKVRSNSVVTLHLSGC